MTSELNRAAAHADEVLAAVTKKATSAHEAVRAEARRPTHYAVILFSGDPDNEHLDESLRGAGPHMTLIACGPYDFCWRELDSWTHKHPLREWEHAEVLARETGEQQNG